MTPTNEMPALPVGISSSLVIAIVAVALVLFVFNRICWWRILTKAQRPGWAVLVPVYSIIVRLQMLGKPIWWILILMIPPANLILFVLMVVALAEVFDRSIGFAIGLLLLGPVFLPILAFGDAAYQKPDSSIAPTPAHVAS